MCCAFNKTRGMNIKMREVEQKNYTFSNDDYLSVFVGVCKSQELLDKYLKKNYELIEDGFIGSEFGVDFNINTYDEDFMVSVVNTKMSNDIDEIFAEAMVFDINLLKKEYSDNLEGLYNVALVIGRLKYEGEVKEIHLGVYPEEED